jgi:hypothetical protein
MWHNDERIRPIRVLEDPVASSRAVEQPALSIEASDDLSAAHRSDRTEQDLEDKEP